MNIGILTVLVIVSGFSAFLFAPAALAAPEPAPVPQVGGVWREMRIGQVQITFSTTNPLQATLVEEFYLYLGVYSFLINTDQSWRFEPDIAVQWRQLSPTTWEFVLARNAFFVDPALCTRDAQGRITDCPPAARRQVTADDVKFSYDYIYRNRASTAYLSAFIDHLKHDAAGNPTGVVVIDPFRLTIEFDIAFAPALTTFSAIPILPRYIWEGKSPAWTNDPPVGSGPYLARPVSTRPPIIMDRNPYWHGMEVQGRQSFADSVIYVSYTNSAAMVQDLLGGVIDLVLGPTAFEWSIFLADKLGITRQVVYGSWVQEQAVNVLSDDLRKINPSRTSPGRTNPILEKFWVVRAAVHMATNRQKMIDNALLGLGLTADTLAPNNHPWHYDFPDYSTDDKDGDGFPFDFGFDTTGDGRLDVSGLDALRTDPTLNSFRGREGVRGVPLLLEEFPDSAADADGNGIADSLDMAKEMLHAAGWLYDCTTGRLDTPAAPALPLCRRNAAGQFVDKLEFKFSTFNSPPWWKTAADGVVEDAAKVGVKLNLELLSPSQMSTIWYQLNYDIWMWDWVFTPSGDISTGVMSVQLCGEIFSGFGNDNGYCPRTDAGRWIFDDLYNQTLVETDLVRRRQLTDRLQAMVYDFGSYNLPFYNGNLYANNEIRWVGWGNWNVNQAIPPDIGISQLIGMFPQAIDQKPPQFNLPARFEGFAGRPIQFSVAAIDPEGRSLTYRWDFDSPTITAEGIMVGGSEPGGTGVNADGILDNDAQATSANPTFTYDTPGTRVVTLRVSESGGDWFTVKKTIVDVIAPTGDTPRISAVSFSPIDPVVTDLRVNFAAAAVDPQGLALEYIWEFGDGTPPVSTGASSLSDHQYTNPGTYTVRLTVRNSAGRTAQASTLVQVTANVAPVLAPLESTQVVQGITTSFAAFAVDPNSRDTLTYSWSFGDGTTATGNPVTKTYSSLGTFTLSVTVQDSPGGHTVSSSATIGVVTDRNRAPRIDSLSANPLSGWTTQPVTITGTARDPDGNPLRWDWDFTNDGIVDKSYVTDVTAPNEPVTRSERYLYTTPSTGPGYRARLTITDVPATGTPRSVTQTVTITIRLNRAPVVTAFAGSPAVGIVGQEFTFTATATDADGNTCAYIWDFGDGTEVRGTTGTFCSGGGLSPQTHTYRDEGEYIVSLTLDDGRGGIGGDGTLAVVSFPALLRATTNPAVHGKIIVDGVPRDEWGLTWMKIAPGPHTVTFSDVYGLGTPGPTLIDAVAGMTSEVQGNYDVYGSLRVTTEPALPSTIYVNDVARNDWGMWMAVPAGTYKVSFGAVAGWNPPADQTVTIGAGEFRHVNGVFTSNPSAPGPDPATFGMLRATTNPAVHSAISVSGVVRDEWGLAWVKLAPGEYTVSFKGVYGFTTPAPQTVMVRAGETTTVEGVFAPHGSLRVLTNPALPGTIFVNGIPRNDWGMWQSMPPGTYRVSFGPMPGYTMPAAQVATVTAGVLTTIQGDYVAIAPASGPVRDAAESPLAPQPEAIPVIDFGGTSRMAETTGQEALAADGRLAVFRFEDV